MWCINPMILETFFEKFDLFADAPGAVRMLREIVLQLAVRGKLTERMEGESVHSQLKLAETFSIRRDRRSNADEDDIPFPVPASWGWVAVGHCMDMINGRAFKPEEWSTEGIPIVRIQNLNNENAPYNRCKADLDPKIHIHNGDFLISWSGTPGTSFGAFIWNRGFAYLNQHIFRCELVESVFVKEFLRLAINARLDEMISQAHGAVGLRHITKGKLESIQLPLPPLAEQKRVVAKVDELMALCDRLETQQQERDTRHTSLARASLTRFAEAPTPANLQFLFHESCAISPTDLRKSILTLAVQRKLVPQDSSDETATVSMEELVGRRNLKNGLSVLPTDGAAEFFCLPLSAVKGDTLDCSVGKPVALTRERAEPYLIKAQDVFIMRGNGSKDRVGLAAMAHSTPPNILFPDLLIRVPLPKDRIDPKYYLIAWNSPQNRQTIERLAATTSGIWKVNQGHISECEIPLPSLAEQRRIVAKVDELLARVDRLETDLATARVTAAKLLDAAVAELTQTS